ncbi:MAG TPA: hypothetical protein ENH72_13850 [Pseudomonas sabulinigri]|uniref:Uncharacterized protein n=1 Tax=marine sediment metagenome TaxID=412755 RepID=A0A0F9TCG3_9ZZZZ|nr:hypothetical protein [Halopseudomonas sabulinigri]HEC53751.1 hypothetical protein [Halopseudomonas sabulinigri]
MTEHVQKCGACGEEVKGELYHLGFSDMDAVYCWDCPNVLLIKDHDFFEKNGITFPHLMPGDKGWQEYNKHMLPYYKEAEKLFPGCGCGGSFRFMAPPRCPKCNDYLAGKDKDYGGKPYYRYHKYVFVTVGSVYLENGRFCEST